MKFDTKAIGNIDFSIVEQASKLASRSRIILAVIFISGFILRIRGINDPLTYDEAYTYVAFASRSFLAIVSDYSLPNNHIFHSVLVHISTLVFGNHPWSVSIPATSAGMGMILAAYMVGKSFYSRKTGLAAAALTAYFPELVLFSTTARGYSLVGLFTLLIFWLGWQVVFQPNYRTWTLPALALCTALGFWTIPTMLFPAGALYIWLFLEGGIFQASKRREFFISFFLSGLGAGVLTVLLYSRVLVVSGWQSLLANRFIRPVNTNEYFDSILPTRLFDTWLGWTQDIPIILTVFLVRGFVLALVSHWKITPSRVPLQLITASWIALLVIIQRPSVFDRFWSFLMAPLLIWSAAGFIETAKKIRIRSIRMDSVLAGLVILFLIVQSVMSISSIPSRWSKMGNPEAAALYLKDVLQPGDLVLAGYPNDATLWYYLGMYGVPKTAWRAREDASRTYFVLAANRKDQTLESIAKSYKLDPGAFPLDRAKSVERYGQLIIYLVENEQ